MRWMFLFSFFLVGCLSTHDRTLPAHKSELPPPPMADGSLFGEKPPIISLAEIFKLSPAQINTFLATFNDPGLQDLTPNRRMYKYLEGHLRNFNFYSNTLTAGESLIQNQGNCLSLAILTKALATQANVDIAYQLVETEPVYQKEGDIILSSQHVRTLLYDPKPETRKSRIWTLRNSILVDYFPAKGTRMLRSVDENEFYSMYYRNRAAEIILKGDNKKAYWYLRQSLELKPDDAHGINMMALVHDKMGLIEEAERLYRYGIEHTSEKLELLSNYLLLLRKQKRSTEAKTIVLELAKYDDPNPFKWISLGNSAYNLKHYDLAISHYKRASRLAPYLHETYAGVSRSQFQLGHISAAHQTMEKALTSTHNPKTKQHYQAKFDMLSQLLASQHNKKTNFKKTSCATIAQIHGRLAYSIK